MTISLSSEDITDLIEVIGSHFDDCPGPVPPDGPDYDPEGDEAIRQFHIRLMILSSRLRGLA